jgi:Flp pilus assembly protein TadG
MTARRGMATLEFAMALPFLLALALGVMEWGHLFVRQAELAQVVRDAASTGSRVRQSAGPTTAATLRCIDALNDAGFSSSDANISATLGTATAGAILTVHVTVPYTPLGGLAPVPTRLGATTTLRMQAP